MKTILIAMVLGTSISVIYEFVCGYYSDIEDYLMRVFTGAFFGFVIGLFIALWLPMETYTKHYSINIELIKDNNSTKGSFFLGSGNIDGRMKYIFYVEENGFYRMMQLDYDDALIKYSNNTPRLNVSELTCTDATINQYAIDLNIGETLYIIEVPEGTIKNNYSLDAE